MRVQFTVSENEWKALEKLASANGYPDIPSYCRDVALQERTYANMWEKITDGIAKLPSGSRFALRDLVQAPPSNLGVKLFNNQKALGIRKDSKDSLHSNTFIKI